MPGLALHLLDGGQAAAQAEEFHVLHAEVYADPPYRQADDKEYPRQLAVRRRQPGFVLAEARNGGYLVGYAAGMPLRPSTSWWTELTTPLPADVTAEHPGRTFALTELLVRASWRRQGIAAALHDLILAGRPEERATAVVWPAAGAAQNAFRTWGWRKVARTRDPAPGSPVSPRIGWRPCSARWSNTTTPAKRSGYRATHASMYGWLANASALSTPTQSIASLASSTLMSSDVVASTWSPTGFGGEGS